MRPLPVRDIRPNTRSVTGTMPKIGKYESTLERDLMEILRFDPEVEQFLPQPLTLEYLTPEGQRRRYTPDGLIRFKATANLRPAPILFEVKYRADFRKDWRVLLPKFRAAKTYCSTQGWRFEVFTEKEIRTPYLNNVKFLWPYVERTVELSVRDSIVTKLWDLEEADPELLLCVLCRDPMNRARFIPIIWNLIAIGVIGCDLDLPLTMRSRIWALQES